MNQCPDCQQTYNSGQARCFGCGRILGNRESVSSTRVFQAPQPDWRSKPKQRMIAAVWFAAVAWVPIMFLGGTPGGMSNDLRGWILLILPVVIAGFFGFKLGFKILDLSETRGNRAAAWKGLCVAGLSFLTYLAILAFVVAMSTPDMVGGWILAYLIFLIFGTIFVGWVALLIGAGSGLLLYRLTLVAGPDLRFSNIPNAVTLKDFAVSVAIVFWIFAPVIIPRVLYPFVYHRFLESESAKTERLSIQMVSAAQMGDAEEIKSLLAEGADPNSRHLTGVPLLALTVPNGHKDAARVLLENGADPDACRQGDWTPLIWAVGSVDPEMMQMLVEFGADVNRAAGDAPNYTPLIKAALANDIAAAKYLLSNGAMINARDMGGKTALGRLLDHKRMQVGMAREQRLGHTLAPPEETPPRWEDIIRSSDKMIDFLRQNGATE